MGVESGKRAWYNRGMQKILTEYFSRDPLLHVDMSEALKLPGTRAVYAARDGVVISSLDMRFVSTEDAETAFRLLPSLDGAGVGAIVLHQPFLYDELTKKRGFHSFMDCHNCAYYGREPVPYTLPQGAEIKQLAQSHAEFVAANYSSQADLGYIRERIDAGLFGVFVSGELAGFAGTHDEGSIGLLQVLPQYRRLGLACALEAFLINRQLAFGVLPFGQVRVRNDASLALQKKIGMTVSDKVVHWLFRDE